MTLLAWLFCAVGALLCVNNWWTLKVNLANARRGGGRHISMVPLAGPLLLLIGAGTLLPGPTPGLFALVLLDAWSWMVLLWLWQRLFDRA